MIFVPPLGATFFAQNLFQEALRLLLGLALRSEAL
jgi:hypothetical protein